MGFSKLHRGAVCFALTGALALALGAGGMPAFADGPYKWNPTDFKVRIAGELATVHTYPLSTHLVDTWENYRTAAIWHGSITTGSRVLWAGRIGVSKWMVLRAILAHAADLKPTVRVHGTNELVSLSRSGLAQMLKHVHDETVKKLVAENYSYFHEYGAEDSVLYGPDGDLYDAATAWAKKHHYPTTFDGFTAPVSSSVESGIPLGVEYKLSGTPRRVVATAILPNGVWLRLTEEKIGGSDEPYASAAKSSAEDLGEWGWILAHPVK